MSTLCPYRIIKGDDGLSVKVEWDVHYLTDEQIGIIRKYVAEIEAENEKLRELVQDMLRRYYRPFLADDADRRLARRAEELGVEV